MGKTPIALGLFSVRDEYKRDLTGTLKALAEYGYEGVEFFGGFIYTAEEVSAALGESKLKVCGWHVSIDMLRGAAFDETVAYMRAIGNRLLILPGLPEEMTRSLDAWRETAKVFGKLAEKLAPYGMAVGYHNHAAEFKPEGGACAWNVFAENTPAAVVLQLDNGNAMSGGADALEVQRRFPGRGRTVHLKPYSLKDGFNTMIGEDDIDWPATLAELDAQGATEWLIVEYECEERYSQMEGARVCLEELRKFY